LYGLQVSLEGPKFAVAQNTNENWLHVNDETSFSDWMICDTPQDLDDFAGSCLDFDGTDDYVDLGSTMNLKPDSNLTLETWAYADDWTAIQTERFISNTQGGGYGLGSTPTLLRGWIFVNGSYLTVSEDLTNIDPGWHHFSLTFDGRYAKLFIDGDIKASNDAGDVYPITYHPTNNTLIGAEATSGAVPTGGYFYGKLDEIRFWNIARDSVQIRENMYLPLTGLESDLVSYWQFNEGSGTVLEDNIFGNDGTLTDMTEEDWIDSSIPFGNGISNTQIETTGSVDFSDTGFSMDFSAHNAAEITVTRIDTIPNLNPTEPDEAFDSQYWNVNRFGTGSFDADLTFAVSEDLTIEDESNPSNIRIYTRESNDTEDWINLSSAGSVNTGNDEATFDGIDQFSQFIIGRKTPSENFPGTCLDFDGTNDYINIGNHNSLNIGDSLTIEAWIKPQNLENRQSIFSTRADNDSGCFQLEMGSGTNRVAVTGIGTWVAQTEDNAVSTGEWFHIVYTRNGAGSGIHKIYVNGEEQNLISDDSYAFINNDSDKLIGSTNGSGGFLFSKLEEVRLWNICRTEEEIRENMYLALTGNESGLVSYWQFNDGSGSVVRDVGSGNNGTLFNMNEEDWITSTVPFGEGFVNTQIVSSHGVVNFSATGLEMDFTAKTGVDTIVVTRIDTIPNINPAEPDEVFDAQYWVVNRFGTGSFDADLTFTINENFTSFDENNPSNIRLYTRTSNADTNWVYLMDANSVHATTDEVTFDGITDFSQFIIGIYEQSLDIPQNITIEVIGTEVQISWDAVSGANSYKIYSSEDPDAADWGPTIDAVAVLSWTQTITEDKKFYRVVASTETLMRIISSKTSKVSNTSEVLNSSKIKKTKNKHQKLPIR